MNVFVDLGAYNGDSVKKFLSKRKLNRDPKTFKILAFEPNPKFANQLKKLDVVYSDKVAWTRDGSISYSVDQSKTPLGSTVMKGKKEYIKGNTIKRECFDFSDWVRQFEDDYLIVKMDIEGAEFPVLQKMLREGTHKIMDQLWVEMHPNKVNEYTTTDANTLLAKLRKDVYVEEW